MMKHADEFLAVAEQFRLGFLPTEQGHPLTRQLSQLAKNDVDQAVECLRQVDIAALKTFREYLPQVQLVKEQIDRCLSEGGRIFLCGCGATGRLSLSLEGIVRRRFAKECHAFMAGGDIALVHAIEGFEDHPEYGRQQLIEVGFGENDLLISVTEGGETPFVIGATLAAAEISRNKPFFIFCNPEKLLSEKLQRSRAVFLNTNILSMSWQVGPMALAGSTRMQASTVLQLGLGLALTSESTESIVADFEQLLTCYEQTSFADLTSLIIAESSGYKQGVRTIYQVPAEYAITIFTDTTERAPTFNMTSFQPKGVKDKISLCHIVVDGATTVDEAWSALLSRPPTALGWSAHNKTSIDYLRTFDFSQTSLSLQMDLSLVNQKTNEKKSAQVDKKINERADQKTVQMDHESNQKTGHELVTMSFENSNFYIRRQGHTCRLHLQNLQPVSQHLMVKMLMNILSTVVMGRLDRYEGHWMTYVFPSNGKLIDRAARYCQQIAQWREDKELSYEQVVRQLFIARQSLSDNESLVEKTLAQLLSCTQSD